MTKVAPLLLGWYWFCGFAFATAAPWPFMLLAMAAVLGIALKIISQESAQEYDRFVKELEADRDLPRTAS